MSTFSMSIEGVSLSEITLKQAMTSLSLLSADSKKTVHFLVQRKFRSLDSKLSFALIF